MMDEWNLTIGQVVSTFGRIGELKVRVETDYPERFSQFPEICLRLPRVSRLMQVERSRIHKGQALLKLKGVDSITDAEAWRGATVQIRRVMAEPLGENSFFVGDLIGMEVVTVSGQSLGILERILPYPAQDLLQIGDILIPAVQEIVVNVDTAARRITVNPPKGLLPGDEPVVVEPADEDQVSDE